jgi:acetate kinase
MVLTFNSGSSSLKFGLFRVGAGDAVAAVVAGEIETLGDGRCRLRAEDAAGASLIDETTAMADPALPDR